MPTCPKCQGGTFLSEEELVQVLENADPMKVLVKATFQCMSCSERFTRLVCDDLIARRRLDEAPAPQQGTYTQQTVVNKTAQSHDPAEGLKFF